MDEPVTHPTPSPGDSGQDPNAVRSEVMELVKMVLWFLILFITLRTFVIEGYEVQGPSMYPTLEDGDRILVLKLPHQAANFSIFGFRPLGRVEAIGAEDIVVFDSFDDSGKRYVKRVIARGPRGSGVAVEAGATHDQPAADAVRVEIDGGSIYVNNQRIDEGYLPESVHFESSAPPVYLDPDEYYVMGDNRDVSKDTRSFGAVGDDSIIGRAVLRFWPLNRLSLLQ